MALEAGVRIAEKYELERELGKGGMGVVWVARHVELGERRVAIKFLLNTLSADLLSRFRREAMLASQMQTRHAVAVLDFGEHEGAPYLVMEYLEGQDLRGLLDQRQRLDPALAMTITDQAARGLQKAHEAGLIHRDIKPENLFLTRDEDGELLVKILDFGIAKSQSVDSGTATGMMIGTVYYMSPEQFQGMKSLDHRTDVWSLACVVYEMFVGARTFTADSALMIGMKILGTDRPVPSQVVAGLPPQFDAWFAKALHPDVNQRFSTAIELAASLAGVLGVATSSHPFPSITGAPSGAPSHGIQFSTTAIATSEVDTMRSTVSPRRVWLPVAAGVVGVSLVAAVAVTSFAVLRASAKASNEPIAGLVSPADTATSAASVNPSPAPAASSAPGGDDSSVLSRATAMAREGDVEGAHELLADVPDDSPMRSDEKFIEVENAWADRWLAAAESERNSVDKARMLNEVVQSGANDARRTRARALLDAMSRPRSAGKTAGPSTPPKSTRPPEPEATATTKPPTPSTGSLPSRF